MKRERKTRVTIETERVVITTTRFLTPRPQVELQPAEPEAAEPKQLASLPPKE